MDKNCIFCKIVKGKMPCFKVYEDHDFLGFLDVNPLTKGHTLVIPKKHYRWVDEVPNFGDYFKVAQKVGLAAKKVFNPDWVCYLTLGLKVAHAHIHIIPRYPDDLHGSVITLEKTEDFSDQKMKQIATRLRQNIKS